MGRIFTPEEDEKLLELVMEVGYDWPFIDSQLGKTSGQSQARYYYFKRQIQKKFSKNETQKLTQLVKMFGKDWDFIASEMKKPSLECRLMYDLFLHPRKYYQTAYFSESEDNIICDKLKLGLQAKQISRFIPNKSLKQILQRIKILKRKHKL